MTAGKGRKRKPRPPKEAVPARQPVAGGAKSCPEKPCVSLPDLDEKQFIAMLAAMGFLD